MLFSIEGKQFDFEPINAHSLFGAPRKRWSIPSLSRIIILAGKSDPIVAVANGEVIAVSNLPYAGI